MIGSVLVHKLVLQLIENRIFTFTHVLLGVYAFCHFVNSFGGCF